jgi:predicted ATPase
MLIDEPELGLHPYAITVLASLMRSAATKTQVIVSTQSVSLVNQFDPEDLLIVERRDQATIIEPLDAQRLAGWLEEYALGELWEKNVLGGRPSR